MGPDYRRRQRELRASPLTEGWRKLTGVSVVEQDGIRISVPGASVDRRTRSQIYRGVYEVTKRIVAEHLVRPGDRVLELGAGMGLVTVTAARLAGPGKVVSYEAVPSTFEQLSRNVEINGVDADLRCRAIAEADGEIGFFVNDDVISSSAAQGRGSREIRVPADSISRIMRETTPAVLLMDVEGAEREIVELCPLDGVRAVMIQVHLDIISDADANRILMHFINAGLLYRMQLSLGDIWVFARDDAGRDAT